MSKMRDEIKKLEEERSRLDEQIAELEHKLHGLKSERAGFDRALNMLAGKDVATQDVPRKERAKGVKETVLAAVQAAGGWGITVSQLMERAEREGRALDRGTVSSLLSRFKREGVLEMKEGRYYVPQHPPKTEGWPASVN